MGNIIGSAIGATNTSINNAANALYNEHVNQEQMEFADYMWNQNSMFQANEADKNRHFAMQQAELAQEQWYEQAAKSQDYWKEQQQLGYDYWLQQQQYNSPEQLVQRYAQAGLNPAAAMNLGAYGSTSGTSTSVPSPSPSAPSPGSAPAGSSPGANLGHIQFEDISNGIRSIGTFIQSLSESEKNSAQVNEIVSLLGERVKNFFLQNQGLDIVNEMQNLQLFVKKNIKDWEVNKAYEEWLKVAAERLFIDKQADLAVSQKEYQVLLNKLKAKTSPFEFLQVMTYTQNLAKLMQSNIALNNASAANQQQQSDLNKFWNTVYNHPSVKHSVMSEIESNAKIALNNEKLTKSQYEHLNVLIEQARYAKDMQAFSFWSNEIKDYVKTLGQAAGEITRTAITVRFLKGRSPGTGLSPVAGSTLSVPAPSYYE